MTYPFTTLTVGTLLYIAFIPVSFWTYGKREELARAQAEAPSGSEEGAEAPAGDLPERQRPAAE